MKVGTCSKHSSAQVATPALSSNLEYLPESTRLEPLHVEDPDNDKIEEVLATAGTKCAQPSTVSF